MADSRIYAVADGDQTTLVRAISRAQAVAHIARSRFSVRVASQEDIVGLVSAGATVDDATAVPQPSPGGLIHHE